MKKSLIALAVLAASGASMAQSSVTMYGIADVLFANTKAETAAATGATNTSLSQNVIASGGVNGSRWGIKGSEDLGGGLKANFDFQQGFTIDDGASNTFSTSDGTGALSPSKGVVKTNPFAFARQSWVGVSGGFGAVRLGRTTTPFDDVNGSSNSLFDSAISPVNTGGGLGVFKSVAYNARPNNTIYYQAPTMSGISGAVSYSLGENKAPGVDAGTVVSLNLTYANGPVAAQLAYQTEQDTGATETVKYTRLGGSYNFGVATAKASYGKAENFRTSLAAQPAGAIMGLSQKGKDATEWQLGFDVPVSAAMTVSAGYATSSDNATAGSAERKGYGVGASYTLSKRTFLYGGYGSATTSNVAGKNDATNSIFALGMQHRF